MGDAGRWKPYGQRQGRRSSRSIRRVWPIPGSVGGGGRDDDDGRGPGGRADGPGGSERGASRDTAGAGTAMSDRGGPRGERGALAAGRRDAAHASTPPVALGPPPLCDAEDARGAAVRGGQTGDAVSALSAPWPGEGVGRGELGGSRLQPAPCLRAQGRTRMQRPAGGAARALRDGRVAAASVSRLPRQLCWPRHAGGAYHERDTLVSSPEPRRSLGSGS
jgi:hypothetical protein